MNFQLIFDGFFLLLCCLGNVSRWKIIRICLGVYYFSNLSKAKLIKFTVFGELAGHQLTGFWIVEWLWFCRNQYVDSAHPTKSSVFPQQPFVTTLLFRMTPTQSSRSALLTSNTHVTQICSLFAGKSHFHHTWHSHYAQRIQDFPFNPKLFKCDIVWNFHSRHVIQKHVCIIVEKNFARTGEFSSGNVFWEPVE